MKRMRSKEEVVDIVNEGIEKGEIETGGGGSTLYQHFIYKIDSYGAYYSAGLVIINADSTPITSQNAVATFLKEKGFDSSYKGYPAYGTYRASSETNCITKVWYSSNGVNLTLVFGTPNNNLQEQSFTSATFVDNVITLN